MTLEQKQAAWLAYSVAMKEWRRLGYPHDKKPRLPLQIGSHLDTLPVEVNKPGTVNMPAIRS